MSKKESKLLKVKPFHIIISAIIFLSFSIIFAALALIIKEGEAYEIFAELFIACLCWLMPIACLISAIVGFKSSKKQMIAYNKKNKALVFLAIVNLLIIVCSYTFIFLIK